MNTMTTISSVKRTPSIKPKSNFFAKKGYYNKKPTQQPQDQGQEEDPQLDQSINFLTEEYRQRICATAYLGKKGYTLMKENLVKADLEFLYKDLFCKPATFGPGAAAAALESAFPVYRENPKKLYIPRFYGIERYGLPPKSEIEYGTPINLPFEKPLRDYQDKIIDVYMNHVTPNHSGGGILEVPCGFGKCLGKDTPILLYDGTIKLVQDVVVGDVLMGDDSLPRNVLSLARGREMMYKIADKWGNGYIVNESHILSLKLHLGKQSQIIDISVADYLKLPTYFHDPHELLMGYRVPIQFQKYQSRHYIDTYTYGKTLYNDTNTLNIPPEYKCAPHIYQLELLAGIIDAAVDVGNCDLSYKICISHASVPFIDDIIFMARSIGLVAYRYYVMVANPTMILHQDKRFKWIPIKSMNRYSQTSLYSDNHPLDYNIRVIKLEEDEYYGFEIDGNRRFVLGDFIVTHNTVMALKIVSLLQQKTLIIVHKEFLMNQWIERIGEFLPAAKVGKIQGQTFDVEGKDIVLGMLQSLYDKEFPPNAFDTFGLTIVDEVHRIGSEQFSKTLLRVITPYMLGISATVDRKDKLTKVLYMFIGPKIYTQKREDEDLVCVRAIEYCSRDTDFNEVIQDYRGNTMYSSMITKLCAFGPRCDFIVQVIADLIEESPENQIMILAHNRSLLTYFYEAINHKQIAEVGYYVGGMKQHKLQETETKQIVLATYAMAAEALDIKTLSTLIMATPKTDIIQSVGRILRVRHDNPIVVDIVDRHDIFQNQWKQRRVFYKKCNYRIRMIESTRYGGMNFDWNEDKVWNKVFEPKAKKEVKPKGKAACMVAEDGVNPPQQDQDQDQDQDEDPDSDLEPTVIKPVKCMIEIDELDFENVGIF